MWNQKFEDSNIQQLNEGADIDRRWFWFKLSSIWSQIKQIFNNIKKQYKEFIDSDIDSDIVTLADNTTVEIRYQNNPDKLVDGKFRAQIVSWSYNTWKPVETMSKLTYLCSNDEKFNTEYILVNSDRETQEEIDKRQYKKEDRYANQR